MEQKKGRTYLLEIGVEEMPAALIPAKEAELKTLVETFLTKERLTFTKIKVYSTPRRLAVLVEGLADKQDDLVEVLRGPRKKVALAPDGTWTQAAKGFAASRGLDLKALYFEGEGDDAVLTGRRKTPGGTVDEVLLSIPEATLGALAFPKTMRWGTEKTRFIRPIRYLVSLLDDTVIPIRYAGLVASRVTEGHRFLGGRMELSHAEAYEASLRAQYVIADRKVRKETIVRQIEDLARLHEAFVPIDPDLLEEVTDLVEWPTAFWGTFDEQFLLLPRDVLMLTMKIHQRYFYVEDESGALLPFFVGVRNGDTHQLATVVRGNEKVLSARLSDARFFYEEDLKGTVDDYVMKLQSLTFHARLGSMLDKTARLVELSGLLADRLKLDLALKKNLQRAAHIAKFDLVTHMVYEFPELEGTMGEVYARALGEDLAVATAVREHTYPRGTGGPLPSTRLGALLSLIDKVDTLVSFFAIGEIPSGSEDPYALRRALNGVIQLLDIYRLPLSFQYLFFHAYHILARQQKEAELIPLEDVVEKLWTFVAPRLVGHLEQKGLPYDLAQALVYRPSLTVGEMVARGNALKRLYDASPERYRRLVQALIRSIRLAEKSVKSPFKTHVHMDRREAWVNDVMRRVEMDGEVGMLSWDNVALDESLLKEPQEQVLLLAVKNLLNNRPVSASEQDEDVKAEEDAQEQALDKAAQDALFALEGLVQPIEQFFDVILVMSEDRALREARLMLLSLIAFLAYSFADFEAIVLDG
ncbi:MAG: glycine--tRNA ligase subunit beta [Candidatus Carbobacillus altaicus]|nr:glycine--tRNA ligase subunit beta [Candidatus Carbobacillus altaicus]